MANITWRNQTNPNLNAVALANASAGKMFGQGFDALSGATDYFKAQNIAARKAQDQANTADVLKQGMSIDVANKQEFMDQFNQIDIPQGANREAISKWLIDQPRRINDEAIAQQNIAKNALALEQAPSMFNLNQKKGEANILQSNAAANASQIRAAKDNYDLGRNKLTTKNQDLIRKAYEDTATLDEQGRPVYHPEAVSSKLLQTVGIAALNEAKVSMGILTGETGRAAQAEQLRQEGVAQRKQNSINEAKITSARFKKEAAKDKIRAANNEKYITAKKQTFDTDDNSLPFETGTDKGQANVESFIRKALDTGIPTWQLDKILDNKANRDWSDDLVLDDANLELYNLMLRQPAKSTKK